MKNVTQKTPTKLLVYRVFRLIPKKYKKILGDSEFIEFEEWLILKKDIERADINRLKIWASVWKDELKRMNLDMNVVGSLVRKGILNTYGIGDYQLYIPVEKEKVRLTSREKEILGKIKDIYSGRLKRLEELKKRFNSSEEKSPSHKPDGQEPSPAHGGNQKTHRQ